MRTLKLINTLLDKTNLLNKEMEENQIHFKEEFFYWYHHGRVKNAKLPRWWGGGRNFLRYMNRERIKE